jgi:PAS domain S-box-containing protein
MIFVELLYNLSLLIALSIVSGFFDKRYPRTTLTGLIVQGLLFGIVGLIGMMHPMNLGAELIFDGRSVVISLSTLFFGPISGSIAGMITIIFQIIQGGSGIVPGTLVAIFSVVIGSIFHFQKKKRNEEITVRQLLYLGFTVHIVMLLMMFSLPFPTAISVIQRIGIPVIICYPLATVLIGKILSDQALNFRIIENIKASELKFRTVANYTYDLEYWKNEDQKLVYISPSCERITGYSQDEFYANPALFEKIVHSEDFESFIEHSKKVYSYEQKDDYDKLEFRIVKKDGTIVNIYYIYGPIFDSNNKFHGGRVSNRDITDRKKAEEELRKSEEKYRNLIDNMNEGIFILDEKGTILFANNALARIHGFDSPDKLLNKNFIEFVEPSVKKETLKNFANEIQSGKSANEIEVPIVSADGSIVYVLIRSSIIRYGQRIAGVNGIVSDITDRKQAENALHESEKRFRSLYENSTIGLYRTTPDGKIILANPTLIKMLRYSSFEELATLNLEKEGFDTSDRRKYFIEQIEKNGEVIGLKSAWIRKDETVVYVSESSKAIRDSNGKTLYYDGTVEDITEQRNAEEALRKSEEKYRSIFENVQDVYYEASIDGTLIEVSPSIEILSNGGYRRDDLIGISMYDYYIIPGGRQAFLALLKEQGSVTDYEIILENRDGSHVPCSISAKIQFDAHHTPLKIIGSLRNITERKRAEGAMLESEAKFRTLVTQSPDGIFIVDLSGTFLSVNKAICDNLKYSEEEFLSMKMWDIVPLKYLSLHRNRLEAVLKGESKKEAVEYEVKGKDGIVHFIEVLSAPYYKNKEIIGFQGIARFITEKKQAEEKVRESEERFRMVFENVFDGISIYSEDPDPSKRRLIECNEQYSIMAGRGRDELLQLGSTLGLQITLEDNANKDRLESLDRGIAYQGFFSWIRPDEKENIIEYVGMPITWRGKSYSIGIDRDITERKRSEEKIAFLAHSLKSINECVCITDMEDKFIFVNESFLKTYGYDENELIGKYMTIVRSPNNSPELVKEILPATLQGGWQGELWNKRKDGSEFLIYLSTTIINDKEGNPLGLIGVATDITERKRTEKELINAKEKAEESDKLKSEFLAQMSHEIRTPINAIVGNVDYLNESFGKKMDSDARECFEGIELASKRIIRTVDLVLNAAELQTSGYKQHFVKVDLNSEILNKLYQEHQLSAKKKGLEFIYTCTEKDTYVIADEYSITQIFANLIDNAIKYTKNGKVEILLGKNKTNNIIVEVKDTGIGISKEFLPRIFEVFAQEEHGYTRSFDGNGLGLALVKKYCELNKIIIEVDSKKNIGSTFRVIFDKKV